jgi:hypothetical protein
MNETPVPVALDYKVTSFSYPALDNNVQHDTHCQSLSKIPHSDYTVQHDSSSVPLKNDTQISECSSQPSAKALQADDTHSLIPIVSSSRFTDIEIGAHASSETLSHNAASDCKVHGKSSCSSAPVTPTGIHSELWAAEYSSCKVEMEPAASLASTTTRNASKRRTQRGVMVGVNGKRPRMSCERDAEASEASAAYPTVSPAESPEFDMESFLNEALPSALAGKQLLESAPQELRISARCVVGLGLYYCSHPHRAPLNKRWRKYTTKSKMAESVKRWLDVMIGNSEAVDAFLLNMTELFDLTWKDHAPQRRRKKPSH